MALAARTRLGPYEIIAPLGVGGMGEVYRARDTRLSCDVVIKTLPASLAHDSERVARFEREARLLASLSHPNVAMIHGVERHDGSLCLALELIEGESLAQTNTRRKFPEGFSQEYDVTRDGQRFLGGEATSDPHATGVNLLFDWASVLPR